MSLANGASCEKGNTEAVVGPKCLDVLVIEGYSLGLQNRPFD